jgi:predicted DNA-binding transcriptional regulator YafY
MSQTERIYKIDQLLASSRVVSFGTLRERLEVSRATLKRDLAYMRDRLHAPIIYDREMNGYRFDTDAPRIGGQYELPGLWFSPQEIHALLTMQHLLANLDPGGILAPHVKPLMARLNHLLGTAEDAAEEIRKRILIVGQGKRAMKLEHFERVGSALLRRKRLLITYYARGKDEVSEREVSPQRLVHYRENWYLDAWCHVRRELRNFAVDSIRNCEVLEKPVREVAERTMLNVLGPGYGIFGGRNLDWVKLRFSPKRARWVAAESWHPRQKGSHQKDGCYVLEFPYADHRELLMDILKYGADVEVLEPDALREIVREEAKRLTRLYAG